MVYFKALESIYIIVHKNVKRYIKTKVVERIVSWYRHGLKLGQRKYGVNSFIIGDIGPLNKIIYSFLDLKKVYILLYKLFYHFCRLPNRITQWKQSMAQFPTFMSICWYFQIDEGKQYSIDGISINHISVKDEGLCQQIIRLSRRKFVDNLIRSFTCSRR